MNFFNMFFIKINFSFRNIQIFNSEKRKRIQLASNLKKKKNLKG